MPDHLRYDLVLIHGFYDCPRIFPGKNAEYLIGEPLPYGCLLYTSDAADDPLCVDLGGRRIIKKKNTYTHTQPNTPSHPYLPYYS